MFALRRHRPRHRLAALIALPALLVALVTGLGGCDAAWDGPGLLAAAGDASGPGPGPGSDTWTPAPDATGGPDVGEAPDAVAPPPDTGAPEDGGPGPADVPADVGADVPEDATPDVPTDTGPVGPDTTGPLCGGESTVNPMLGLFISGNASEGQGLDLDGNESTCAPTSACADGVDNSLATIAFIQTALTAFVLAEGIDVLPTIQPLGRVTDDRFPLGIWPARSLPGETCDASEPDCYLMLYDEADDDQCGPAWVLDGAHIEHTAEGDVLVAGRFDSEHFLELDLGEDIGLLNVSVYALQLRAKVEIAGGHIVSIGDGTLGGAIERLDLFDLLGLLDDELDLTYVDLFLRLVNEDIDVDGDGAGDAMSFAIKFTAREGEAISVLTNGLPLSMGQRQ